MTWERMHFRLGCGCTGAKSSNKNGHQWKFVREIVAVTRLIIFLLKAYQYEMILYGERGQLKTWTLSTCIAVE